MVATAQSFMFSGRGSAGFWPCPLRLDVAAVRAGIAEPGARDCRGLAPAPPLATRLGATDMRRAGIALGLMVPSVWRRWLSMAAVRL